MMMRKAVLTLMFGAGLIGAVAPVLADRSGLGILDDLDHGSWELRIRGESGQTQHICLENGRRLIQLKHPALSCSQQIVESGANEVTVQYTCPGQGYGRTHIRRENNRLVQIDSQGIAQRLPFAFVAEARRVGECGN